MKTETQDAMHFFCKAIQRLDEALLEDQSNPLAIDGSIQRFEFSFELAWKLLKKLLMDLEGLEAMSPKRALQLAFQLGWIDDEMVWYSGPRNPDISLSYALSQIRGRK
jgi:nucleotidyltransferase substrate binding protein (TIGR01987 family)